MYWCMGIMGIASASQNVQGSAFKLHMLSNLYLINVILYCRSRNRRKEDDTPVMTPAHKYNSWANNRKKSGATPQVKGQLIYHLLLQEVVMFVCSFEYLAEDIT